LPTASSFARTVEERAAGHSGKRRMDASAGLRGRDNHFPLDTLAMAARAHVEDARLKPRQRAVATQGRASRREGIIDAHLPESRGSGGRPEAPGIGVESRGIREGGSSC
jgi:hypothetical protein